MPQTGAHPSFPRPLCPSSPPLAVLAALAVLPCLILGTARQASATWTQTGPLNADTNFRKVIADDSVVPIIYLGGGRFDQTRIFKHNGIEWLKVYDQSVTSPGIISLAASHSNPSILLAGNSNGVIISINGGSNWSYSNNVIGAPSGRWVTGLAIDPNDPQIAFAASNLSLIKTLDGGATWRPVTTGLPDPPFSAVLIDPRDSHVLFAASTRGVYRSENQGASWSPILERGNDEPTIDSIVPLESRTPPTFRIATIGSQVSVSAGDSTWTPILTLDGGLRACDLVINPTRGDILYAALCGYDSIGGVTKSTDGGKTWNDVSDDLPNKNITDLLVHPITHAIYAVTPSHGLFRQDLAPICGDAELHSTESCDDGNTSWGDGCSATCTAEAIDLKVKRVTFTQPADLTATVNVTVANTGSSRSRKNRLSVYLSKNGKRDSMDLRLDRAWVRPISGNTTRSVDIAADLSGASPGSYRMIACIDDTNVISERREANNCKASAVASPITLQ